MKILHHDDLDGRCAAAIVLMKYSDAECIEMSYSTPVPFDRIMPNEEVIIVDFSLQKPGDWERLWHITHNIIWIDHHESAINKAFGVILYPAPDEEDKEFRLIDLHGRRRTNRCGAWLTWEFYHTANELPPPEVVDLVDRWDRWVHNDAPEVLDFVAGMGIVDHGPGDPIWLDLFNEDWDWGDTLHEIQDQGRIISVYQSNQNEQAVKRFAFPLEWEGYTCIVLYTDQHHVSKLLDSVRDQYDVLIAINFDGQQYIVNLRSDSIRVNDIAVKYGGDGHPGAAGFECERLPWLGEFQL